MYKIKDNHPKADQAGHPPRSLGSFPGHLVSLLPHPYSKKALLFSPLQVETHHKLIQDSTLWIINSPKDLQKCYKTHLTPLSEDGNKPIPAFGWCPYLGGILQAKQDRWTESSLTFAEVGLWLSHDKCRFEPTQVSTYLGLTFNTTEITISLPKEKVQIIKAQVAKPYFIYTGV